MTTLEEWLTTLHLDDLDSTLLETAFTHSSYKGLGFNGEDYDRLEFLGDAVIDIIVSKKLYTIGKYDEGDLTELRSLFVKEKPLADLFDKMEISSLVRRAGTSLTQKMKSDVVEAFFAVIYLEKDLIKCREVWDLMMDRTGFEEEVIYDFENKGKKDLEGLTPEQIVERNELFKIYEIFGIKTNQNARNVLQQLFTKMYITLPDYKDYDPEGQDHAPTYIVRLNETITLKRKTYHLNVEGVASKLKHAQIKAAEKACDILYLPYIKI